VAADAAETERSLAGPYPGLRPFLAREADIFFGREQMTEEVMARLTERHMVVVHGASGCGKSSLVAAGVLPQLARRRARRGLTLRVGTFRPGSRPMQQLVRTIAELVTGGAAPDDVQTVYRGIAQRQGARAELARIAKAAGIDQLCVVVDQFEELFRFAEEESFEEAQRFADVLVSLAGASDRPANWWEEEGEAAEPQGEEAEISFLLTMRSEFLGDCSRYPGLAEAINRTQYLLPNMERSDLIRAIREPAEVFGGTVDHELAERMADDAARDQDSLPLVQHALMKLWRTSATRAVGIADYEAAIAASGQSEALRHKSPLGALLAGHADAVLADAAGGDPTRVEAAGYIFRALTRKDSEGRAIRCPQRLRRLEQVSGVSPEVTREIVDAFRGEGVSFLTPYQAMEPSIDGQTVIDISHEALIRTWPRMSERAIDPADAQPIGWVEREAQEAMLWRWVVLHADFFSKNSSAYLDGTTTDRIGAWFETLTRRPEWVRHYLLHPEGREDVRDEPEWKAVEKLLEESRRRTWIERTMVRRWKKLGWGSLVLLAIALIGLGLGGLHYWHEWQRDEARHQLDEARQRISRSLHVTDTIVRGKDAKRAANSDSAKDEAIAPQLAAAAAGQARGALLTVRTRTAFVWIGQTRGQERISFLSTAAGAPVLPEAVRRGEAYRIRGAHVLRRDLPGSDYAPGPAIGLITHGAEVRARSLAQSFTLGSRTEYWLEIEANSATLPRVAMGFANDRAAAREIQLFLQESGYRVSAAPVRDAESQLVVRYCGTDDAAPAHALARAVSVELTRLDGYEASTVAPSEDCGSASPGQLRLLIDFTPARS
jgi:hypothetical protein